MSCVWGGECQECKGQKSKLILFNDILLNEISDSIDGYICCNDCSKMLKVINDPIYKTLNEEQRMIFKFVKLFPFPKNIKALKKEFCCMAYATVDFEGVSLYMVNKGVFSVLKYIYENLYMDWKEETIKELSWSVTLEWWKRNWDYGLRTALEYIFSVITNLMIIYKVKSEWGRGSFEERRSSSDLSYPSYHKYIQFAMGSKDVSSWRHIIHKRLDKNNEIRFRDL